MSVSVYYVDDTFMRQCAHIAQPQLTARPDAEYLSTVLLAALRSKLDLSDTELAKRVVMGASDGASVLQGAKGVLAKVQQSHMPFALKLHCMAHKIDLAAGAIDKHDCASYMNDIMSGAYDLFCRSPLRKSVLHSRQAELGLRELALLRDVQTRWISHFDPLQRFLENLAPLFLSVDDIQSGRAGQNTTSARSFSKLLCNYNALLSCAALLPLLSTLNCLIKVLQQADCYIVDMMDSIQQACERISDQYSSLSAFGGAEFKHWHALSHVDHQNSPVVVGRDSQIHFKVTFVDGREQLFPLEGEVPGLGRGGSVSRPQGCSKEQAVIVVDYVKRQAILCSQCVTSELNERFESSETMKSLAIIFPQVFVEFNSNQFQEHFETFAAHFGVSKGSTAPLVDATKMSEQLSAYVDRAKTVAKAAMHVHSNTSSVPSVVRFWRALHANTFARECFSEWFVAAKIVLTMVCGSVADERVFSSMNFLKSDLRSRLSTHFEAAMLLYKQNVYGLSNFPYDQVPEEVAKVISEEGEKM